MKYNNKVLSAQELEEFNKKADDTINNYSNSIDGIHALIEECQESRNQEFKTIMQTQMEVSIFINYSFADCVLLTNLFVNASDNYEKSFLSGKLKVHLNESFKQLYGFTDNAHKKSYCSKLQNIINILPEFKAEYESILNDLENVSKQDNWWKDIRDAEVHIDIFKLYESRHKKINENEVVIETLKLIDLFNKFNNFMSRMNKRFIESLYSKQF